MTRCGAGISDSATDTTRAGPRRSPPERLCLGGARTNMSTATLTPAWDDAPLELQLKLASLDKMDNEALWRLAKSSMAGDFARRDELLARNAEGPLSPEERAELDHLRFEEDRFMLRKAHAAALLRWRGHMVPGP